MCTIYMYIHLVLISRISRIPERAFGYYFPISRTVQCTGNLIPLGRTHLRTAEVMQDGLLIYVE